MKTADRLAENLDSWDRVANMHARGSGAEFYRIEQWLAGECKLGPWEVEELGPVDGKRLLHMQCHIGTDTLSWARRGAKVTGLDFSPNAITEARRFAKILDIDARFVVSPVDDAVAALDNEKFDILYTGRGALCWLPDLKNWARVCRDLLAPGGILYLEETHPFLNMMDLTENDLMVPKYDLFTDGPDSEIYEGSYADRDAKTGEATNHCWEYRFDTLINALLGAGFRIDFLHERPEGFFKPWGDHLFVPAGPNYWRLKDGIVPIPMSFTLHATLL